MTMDELLTRMLEVEKEADGIVSDAKGAANELLAEARRSIADGGAAAREADAKATEAVVTEAIAAAEADRKKRLTEAAGEQAKQAEAFQAKLETRRKLVTDALLGL